MFKLFILVSIVSSTWAAVALYGQCGGQNYTGDKTCATGAKCVVQNPYYSQCVPGDSTQAPTQAPTQATQPTTTKASASTQSQSTSSTIVNSKFPAGQFRVGRNYDQPSTDYSQYDYVSIWINTPASDGSGTNFNPWYQGEMIKAVKKAGKIPLFYAYIIAFEGRYKADLQDCDVRPTNNLCTNGADFIKKNRELLVSRYAHHAKEIAKAMGDKNSVCIFVMEPDFWQFYGDHKQTGGTLTGEYMRALMDDFVKAIKTELPNAIISWDISAWIGVDGFTKWWSYFKTATYIDFVHTSGGQAHGESVEIKPNELKWADVSRITGKKIIADCGYGVGGGASDNCGPWFTNTINDRIKDGVIALSMANPKGALTNKPKLA